MVAIMIRRKRRGGPDDTSVLAALEIDLIPPARPSRRQVIAAYTALGYDIDIIKGYVEYWYFVVAACRDNGYKPLYITGYNFRRYHHILEATLPDDTVPEDGSAADLLGRYLLDPQCGELHLGHTNASSPPRAEDCQAMVCIRR
jgi:hypothetical protein